MARKRLTHDTVALPLARARVIGAAHLGLARARGFAGCVSRGPEATVPRRSWVLADGGRAIAACGPDCEDLYDDYVKPTCGDTSR
jgi:hypothetical protein